MEAPGADTGAGGAAAPARPRAWAAAALDRVSAAASAAVRGSRGGGGLRLWPPAGSSARAKITPDQGLPRAPELSPPARLGLSVGPATIRFDETARNVLGGELLPCSRDPVTGFFRNGCCETGPDDLGLHTVCAVMTAEFLAYSKAMGNDLSTPQPDYHFPGLKPGDRWCLCAPRWKEALDDGQAYRRWCWKPPTKRPWPSCPWGC